MDTSTTNTLINAVLGFLTLLVTSWVALEMAKIKAKQTDAEKKIDQVHTAVNSERTAMLEKLEVMHDKLTVLETAAGVRAAADAAAANAA